MGVNEYLFMAWAFYSFIKLVIDWLGLEKHKYTLYFAVLQIVALVSIYFTKHFMVGLMISASANIIYYWLVRPKIVAIIKKTTS